MVRKNIFIKALQITSENNGKQFIELSLKNQFKF